MTTRTRITDRIFIYLSSKTGEPLFDGAEHRTQVRKHGRLDDTDKEVERHVDARVCQPLQPPRPPREQPAAGLPIRRRPVRRRHRDVIPDRSVFAQNELKSPPTSPGNAYALNHIRTGRGYYPMVGLPPPPFFLLFPVLAAHFFSICLRNVHFHD